MIFLRIFRSESLASQFECTPQNVIRLPGKTSQEDDDSEDCIPGKFLRPGTVTETVCVRSSCSRLGARYTILVMIFIEIYILIK